MNEQEILQKLADIKAVITDSHVVYTSGKHGSSYVNKDAIYLSTANISKLCREIAERFANDGVDIVVAPAVGGVILSQWTAHHLSEITGREVLSVYAEKFEAQGSWLWYVCFGLKMRWQCLPQWGKPPEALFVIKRGYDKLIPGKKILIVEDVLTTGSSCKKVVWVTRIFGGNVVGVAAICNRGDIAPGDLGDVPRLTALINVKFDTYDMNSCPLCARNIPINTEVGKGREFLKKFGK